MSDPDDRIDLIEALIYGDTFNCAVTFDELWRFSGVAIGRDELRARIEGDDGLRRLVSERDGLFCLAGREPLLDERAARRARAARLRRRALWTARVLRHLPFVRALFLTGSAAADDAPPHADIDLLVVVVADRIGSVFFVMASISSLTRRRLFCPNLYVSDADLAMRPRGAYVAREVAQASALVGDATALWAANGWVRDELPNTPAAPPAAGGLTTGSPLQRALERPLAGRLGDPVERMARRVARRRLHAHYRAVGEPVPRTRLDDLQAGRSLGFHRGRTDLRVARHRRELRTRLARDLARLDAIDA